MNLQAIGERMVALNAGIRSMLIAVRSLARGLPLFVSSRPRTPLRVLCIMAFDTLHMLRHARPLPKRKLGMLAVLLDFGACANAAFDNKACWRHEFRRTLHLLEEAGMRSSVAEYVRRLQYLESWRPLPGGGDGRFQKVSWYREAVVRLSLAMVASTADDNQCLDEAVRATYGNTDLNLLFRIAMQCQIIDDVLDYSQDMSAGLPSFLTASKSLPQALESTRMAAFNYADNRGQPRSGDFFALRSALFLVSTCAKLVLVQARLWQRGHFGWFRRGAMSQTVWRNTSSRYHTSLSEESSA